ncbi:Protein arginine methyltransferase NDUFAF7, mitochondrial [Zea mays]|uniref:Protein arginine methyltransferase NDUFAF7 n=1 Tax=Zea mays TaxID=4577 RepID=A0A3L6FK36_MAIZE|nr:Protein arginine methyltransferase NDUFAF7, mitochondrial [Zea mays]
MLRGSTAASPLVSRAMAAETLLTGSPPSPPRSSTPVSCLPRSPLPLRLLRPQLPSTRRRRTESSLRSPMVIQVPLSASPSIAPASTTPQMIGVWAMCLWEKMGKPVKVNLIELGPGRGTLLADLLRGSAKFDNFTKALSINLVECSPTLQKIQYNTLKCEDEHVDELASFVQPPFVGMPLSNRFPQDV